MTRKPATMKFEIYRDIKKEWRWRLMSRGRVVADSAEGYKRQGKCRRMAEHIILRAQDAIIEMS